LKRIHYIGILLLAFSLCCRFVQPVADFYAENLYPAISFLLSLISSVVPFSLEEIVVLGFAAAILVVAVRAIRRRSGFWRWLRSTVLLLVWVAAWFYMGWGNNYYRTGLLARQGIERAHFSEEEFTIFLEDYTAEINAPTVYAPFNQV